MNKTIAIAIFLPCMLLWNPGFSLAAPESITVTHTYVMGDNESKNEARASCLAEAKRLIAEQAGAYVEVLSKTRNFKMEKDEVLSFTAALVRVKVEKEELAMEGKSLAITLTVSGEVDPEAVAERLDKLAEQRLAEREREDILPRQEAVPPKKEETKKKQAANSVPASPPAAKTPPPRAAKPREAKARLAQGLEETTRLCLDVTEKGMTRGEVEYLLGAPRAVKKNPRFNYLGAKYGHLWVVFRDDIVACVRSRLEYRPNAGGEAHCEGFAFNFVKR